MKLKDFMAAMQAIETDRKLSKEVVVEALQEALAKAFRKHIEIPDALVRVDVNEKSGGRGSQYSRSGTRSCYSGKECHEAENPRGRKACGV